MTHQRLYEKHQQGNLSDQEWEQIVQQLLNAKFDQEKKMELEKYLAQQGIHRKPRTKLFSLRRSLAIAATLLLLLAAGWYLFRPTMTDAQRLATQQLQQPFPLNEGGTRGSEMVEKNRGKALEAFHNRQYEKSIEYLRLIEDEGQAKAADYFQIGLCYMYRSKPDYRNAVRAFGEARSQDPLAFKDEINWFTGLCHVLLGENEAARPYLEAAANSAGSRKQQEARELLEALE